MKKNTLFMSLLAMAALMVGCGGGDDDGDSGGGGSQATAPKVVAVNPANGSTEIPTGDVAITVTYDQAIGLTTTNKSALTITGGTIKTFGISGTTLSITANCPDEGTTVSITIPEGVIIGATKLKASTYSLSFTTKKTPTPTPGTDGHETASEAVKKMIAGWNLGNTLDAWGTWISAGSATSVYETCWGQPVTEDYLMKKLAEKGFTAIRVPVTWMQHMDASDNVDAAWMNRVEEVVKYVLNNGMYCIINVHHDTGADAAAWLKADATTYAASSTKFKKLWTQIANRFKDYNEKLLFEGYNEMLTGSTPSAEWSEPKSITNLTYINKFAQDFVDAVRATGGNNQYRNLIVNTYSASHTTNTLSKLVVPTDPCGNQDHIAIEVHSYDPWNWVNTYDMKWTSQCTTEVTKMFEDLNTHIISKGYPVIIGEYGSNGDNEKTINKNSTDAQKAEAAKQAADITRLCKQYGAAGFYWMGIVDGTDRSQATFKWSMEQVANAIVNGAK